MIYFFIFILKIIDNSISTLRLIIVANGKKLLGAILNLIISFIWILSTSLVIIKDNPYKIIAFALGSMIGSYIGSIIEEKIAIGTNMIYIISKKENVLKQKIEELNYITHIINENILIIMVQRKKRKELLKIINNVDKDAIIISENAKQLLIK